MSGGGWWRHPVVGYVTNFGYTYCTRHGVEKPDVPGELPTLGLKCGKPHTVEHLVRGDGADGMACDWPGCNRALESTKGKPATERVDPSLQENFAPILALRKL